jgi:hypothetical protein
VPKAQWSTPGGVLPGRHVRIRLVVKPLPPSRKVKIAPAHRRCGVRPAATGASNRMAGLLKKGSVLPGEAHKHTRSARSSLPVLTQASTDRTPHDTNKPFRHLVSSFAASDKRPLQLKTSGAVKWILDDGVAAYCTVVAAPYQSNFRLSYQSKTQRPNSHAQALSTAWASVRFILL